jgi:glucosyl-dolichyl phosphate glucuronosyltransferase
MRITVIVCTFNRCEMLLGTLESVAASKVPAHVSWEVLVVDNNSNDRTREVVDQFLVHYSDRFRYIFEPAPGKSYALNTGIRQARGDVLAFMDDDVTVKPTWLWNLTSALDGGEWAGSGGRTLPAVDFSPPTWLSLKEPYNQGGILAALFDLGNDPRELDRAPYGANMAFRKIMFEKFGLFRTDLGPSPNRSTPRPNEDTEFGRRLMAGGERLRYEPEAIAYHPVPKDRIEKRYFLRWWYDFGRAGIRESRKSSYVWGIPRRYLALPKTILVLAPFRASRWVLALDPAWRFYCKCWTWKTAGEIVEGFRQLFTDNTIVLNTDTDGRLGVPNGG